MKQYEKLKHGTADFPVGIHDTVCTSGFALYPHIHREFEFLVMTKGKGTVYIEEEKYELKKGDGIFINSEKLHIGVKTDNEPAEFFAVVFAPEVFGSIGVIEKYVEPVLGGSICPKSLLEEDMLALLDEIHSERDNELKIRANLFHIWEKLLKSGRNTKKTEKGRNFDDVKQVMNYIKENFREEMSLEKLAGTVNISKSYLCRKFLGFVHMTPVEYLIQVRVEKSCEMLKDTDFSVGEIGERCGFNSFSYFSKIFRDRMGCTPKQYRKRVFLDSDNSREYNLLEGDDKNEDN